MTWTKSKIAVVTGVCLLLAGTATLIIIELTNESIRTMPRDWSVLSGYPDAWRWTHGRISVHDDFGEALLVSGKDYGDFTLSANVTASNREASFVIRMKDDKHGYLIVFTPSGTSWAKRSRPHIRLVKQTPEAGSILASFGGKKFDALGNKVKIEIMARGPSINVRLNDVNVLRATDDTFPTGRVGFRVAGNPRFPSDATYSDLVIQEIKDFPTAQANAQTTNTPSTNGNTTTSKTIMNFTLMNQQNQKALANPTDADIRAMVVSLTDDLGPVLTLQTPADAQYLSMDEIAKGKFGFTCKDGNISWTTKKGHECSTEEAIKIIISYRNQTPDWKKLGEWDQVPVQP